MNLIGRLRPCQYIGEHVAGCLGRHVTPFHRRTLGEGGEGMGRMEVEEKAKGKCVCVWGGGVEGRRERIIRAQNSFHFGVSISLNGQHAPLNP